jgi:DNA (cytosine-5)-methyltransferase 1
MPLTAIDLFAGAGGLSLAAQRCGIEVRAAVESDPHACTTYRRNLAYHDKEFPDLIEKDVNSLDWDELLRSAKLARGECTVLLGGPPCQGFSSHRIKDAGVDDPRNELLVRYFDCVATIRPKAFLIENVSGLLWKRHSDYIERLYRLARGNEYRVYAPVVLNARDFGVPQNRKRVFILGFRKDIMVSLEWPPKATHFAPQSAEVHDNGKPPWRTAGEVFEKPVRPTDKNRAHMRHSDALVSVFRTTPKNGGSRSQSERILDCHKGHDGHNDVYGRIDPGRPGPTMTTACINPSKGRFVHPVEDHGITVRHAARFQTFPERFVFYGGIIAAGRQIGNAVPVRLGQHILSLLTKALLAAEDGATAPKSPHSPGARHLAKAGPSSGGFSVTSRTLT